MSDDDIDMDRVITDPQYRQEVIQFLNGSEYVASSDASAARVPYPELADRS
jgi:hypothetical protein